MKVLPSVAFTFRFHLADSDLFSAALKEIIFQKILLTLGIGAKTNVGYGQFSSAKKDKINDENKPEPDKGKGENILDKLKPASEKAAKIMQKDYSIAGEIIFQKKENFLVEIFIEDERILLKKKIPNGRIGTKVRVTFLQNYSFANPVFSVTMIE